MEEKTLSVVIPYYESDPEKPAILKRCVDSYKGYNDLIVVWNDRMGYAKPINKGLALAKGDFIMVSNDDLILESGTLDMLCDPEAVTSPTVNNQVQSFWGCCFCLPRWVYEKVGGLWEGYTISYFDDDDYYNTLRANGIVCKSVDRVKISHPQGGRTLHTFPDHKDFYAENQRKYKERWPKLPY
jgi:GT2 family glycosyltransferase